MNISFQRLYDGDINNVSRLFVTSFFLISSLVIADQNMPLDLNLDSNYVESVLSRQDWREPSKEESNWREDPQEEPSSEESSNEESSNDNWGAAPIYEDNNELEPIISDVNQPSGVLDKREAAPKFQLRF